MRSLLAALFLCVTAVLAAAQPNTRATSTSTQPAPLAPAPALPPAESPEPSPPPAQPQATISLAEAARTYTEGMKAAEAQAAALEKKQQETVKAEAKRQFAGINFGVAIAMMYSLNDDRVDNAVLVPNGERSVVRATSRARAAARVLLETHYFFTPKNSPRVGHGPFLALQPGTEELIVSVGLGYMIGFRREEEKSDSFNLGAAIMVEPAAKVLGAGVKENEALPVGETEIRFQQKPVASLALVASFSF